MRCHYMKPTIEGELPDTVLINIGTNNITKSKQSENETVDEIMEISVEELAQTIFIGWFNRSEKIRKEN